MEIKIHSERKKLVFNGYRKEIVRSRLRYRTNSSRGMTPCLARSDKAHRVPGKRNSRWPPGYNKACLIRISIYTTEILGSSAHSSGYALMVLSSNIRVSKKYLKLSPAS